MRNTISVVFISASVSLFSSACSSDDTDSSSGDGDGDTAASGGTSGDGDMTGDGDTTGGTTGDGDTTGGTSGDGDMTGGTSGDGDMTGGTSGDGDGDSDIGTVMIDERTVLTNADGFVLYYFTPDFSNAENSDGDGVSGTWPAVMVSAPSVAAGLETSDFSNSPSGQTTYKGYALYTFTPDSTPGVATGESGTWPLATTDGPPE